MPTMLDAGKTVVLWLIVIFGVALVLGGGVLVYLGATGDSQVRLLGPDFPYEGIGAIALLCGAIVTFIGLRRGFRSLDAIIDRGKSGVR